MSKITKKSETVSRKSASAKAPAPIVQAPVAQSVNALELKNYSILFKGVSSLLEDSRHVAARSVNAIMTATYWEIGRRIVEHEQRGKARAEYGDVLLKKLGADRSSMHGRGYGWRNLFQMRAFYLAFPEKLQTLSAISGTEETLEFQSITKMFSLPWSAYVRLLAVKNEHARHFYETEALRSGWSVRQLDRQIDSQFYERTALSKNKAAMLAKGAAARPEDVVTPEQEIKDPFILEFLNLKDEYSETTLEDGLIRHLETFLLELGSDFAFIGRQKRLRIGDPRRN
jgi:predicted nuclease of restriction endonuclease-like (RecB) superfamily